MTNLRSLWNPFSKKGKDSRTQAREDKEEARRLLEAAIVEAERHRVLYAEQKRLSEELRKEQRKNHFAEMIHETVPLREV